MVENDIEIEGEDFARTCGLEVESSGLLFRAIDDDALLPMPVLGAVAL
jgi:hypothetical protein